MPTFEPKSVAVIGASASEHKVGHMILRNLVDQGFTGDIYPINPKGGEILGETVYTSLGDITGDIEMAVVVTPAPTVTAVARECGEKGVKWLVVITAGFSEVHTDDGKKMEDELVKIAKKYSMNLVGPNCLGVLRPSVKMNASFAKDMPLDGNIALVSQSGAMAVALMDSSTPLHIGYSLVLSIGNKSAMDESDYLELCEKDEKTKVIGMYLESIKDGQRFIDVASRVSKTKHIVLLKSGVSEHGKKAASSHTGALAGSDGAIQAACVQACIHRAHTSEQFLGLLRTFSTQPALLSPNIAVITNAGGPGILATDAAEIAGLKMPALDKKIESTLRESLPSSASTVNPIDVIGDALEDRYIAALDACSKDPSIDGIAVILTPQVMTPCTKIAEAVINSAKKSSLMPIVTSFMGGETVEEATDLLAKNGVPNFDTPERAVAALGSLKIDRTQNPKPKTQNPKRSAQANTILKGNSGLLDQSVTEQLLALYDIPLPHQGLARNKQEARVLAEKIGYPVIAKIMSPQIIHKTDVGGIRGNLQNEDDLCAAFQDILRNAEVHMPDATIEGVLVQKFLPVGNEFILGGLRDPSFGPMVMVGLGGIYTELFADAVFRIAPIDEREGYKMLQELKSWKLLLGMRGQLQSDIEGVVQALVALSELMEECPSISEIDFNPILVSSEGVIFADAKIVISS
ncbi:MAG: acetate--CoA ligase family protein [bacterium]|nr:acetate--CoA ligase family protein [bacterium]